MGSMPSTMGLGLGSFVALWVLMVAAMMLPSVAPFAALYTRTFTDHWGVRLAAFAAGYLVVWSLAAVPAYWLAWIVDHLASGHPAVATGLGVAIFAGCGIYQLSPLKQRCLIRCRSTLGLLLQYGSLRGRARDLRAGLTHGAYCLACCWALMAVLIALGFMNLVAMVVLTAIVLIEKTPRWGHRAGQAAGLAALLLGVLVLFQPGLAPGLHLGG